MSQIDEMRQKIRKHLAERKGLGEYNADAASHILALEAIDLILQEYYNQNVASKTKP